MTWHADRVRAAGIELARFTAGSTDPAAPVVVLLHGIGHWTSAAWDRLVPHLDPTWRVVAFDLPGFGDSERPRARYDSAFFHTILTALAAGELPPRFALCGHSLGGMIAAEYAGAFPERISHLALIAPLGFAVTPRLIVRALVAPLLRPLTRLEPPRALIVRTLARAVHDPAALDPAVLERTLAFSRIRAWRRAYAGVYAAALGLLLHLRRARRRWARFRGPVLVAWGRHDRYLTVHSLRTARRIYPHGRTVVLEASGHLPMVEQPQLLGAELCALLRVTSPPS
jgi:pimeloyl-ACP methyl ester carboxylesterase